MTEYLSLVNHGVQFVCFVPLDCDMLFRTLWDDAGNFLCSTPYKVLCSATCLLINIPATFDAEFTWTTSRMTLVGTTTMELQDCLNRGTGALQRKKIRAKTGVVFGTSRSEECSKLEHIFSSDKPWTRPLQFKEMLLCGSGNAEWYSDFFG